MCVGRSHDSHINRRVGAGQLGLGRERVRVREKLRFHCISTISARITRLPQDRPQGTPIPLSWRQTRILSHWCSGGLQLTISHWASTLCTMGHGLCAPKTKTFKGRINRFYHSLKSKLIENFNKSKIILSLV